MFPHYICSLQANSENLQNLINKLEHQFSVIAVSERTKGQKEGQKENLQYDSLEGNQPYYEVKKKTLKIGCRFFIKEGLKYIFF